MFRSASWRSVLIAFLVVVPAAAAVAPAPNLPSSYSTDGQEIADLAMDPSGEFVAAVVKVDALKLALPGSAVKHDIFPCDFGAPNSISTGTGCRLTGLNHDSPNDQKATPNTPSVEQTVAYTSFISPGVGIAARYAVAGPGDTLSLWSSIEDSHKWEKGVSTGNRTVNVSIAPDASRIVGAIDVTGGGGRIVVYDGLGALQWTYDFSAKPTSLAYARSGGLLVVGTSTGMFFLHPGDASPPPSAADTYPIDASAVVFQVQVSRNGDAVAAATSHGVVYVPVDGTGKPADLRWNRNLDPSGAQRIALSLNGERFAAATGASIHFYRHVNNSFVAEEVGSAYTTSDASTFTDLAYDASGSLLVAIGGSRVYGFGPDANLPVWTFDATSAGAGGLDLPLKRVVVSDAAERVVVAGKTRLMPYRSLVAATGAFDQAQPFAVQPGSTSQLTFHVTNTGSVPDNYTFVTHFPPGWNGRGPDAISIAPDQSATLNVSVDVPAGQAPGFYGIDVQVRSQSLFDRGASSTTLANPAMNLTVPRAVVLNVTSEDRIPNLHVGAEVTVPVTIRNRGNADGVVNLSQTQALSRGSSWPIRFQEEKVIVPASGEKTVNMIVTAPQDAASGDRNDITIHAKEGTTVEATKLLTVYVDPKFEVHLTVTNSSFEFAPGEVKQIKVSIQNNGNTDDIYNVSATITPASVLNDWRITVDHDRVSVARGAKGTVTITVRPGVSEPRDATLLVKAASNGSGESVDDTTTIALLSKPATPTPAKSFLPDLAPVTIAGVLAIAALALRVGGRRR